MAAGFSTKGRSAFLPDLRSNKGGLFDPVPAKNDADPRPGFQCRCIEYHKATNAKRTLSHLWLHVSAADLISIGFLRLKDTYSKDVLLKGPNIRTGYREHFPGSASLAFLSGQGRKTKRPNRDP